MLYPVKANRRLVGSLDDMDKKQFCYKENCEFVETGWLTVYKVCRTCKTEVSDFLYEQKTEQQKLQKRLKEEQDKKKKDSEPGLFEFLDYYGGD